MEKNNAYWCFSKTTDNVNLKPAVQIKVDAAGNRWKSEDLDAIGDVGVSRMGLKMWV